jgi:hypothetical protein
MSVFPNERPTRGFTLFYFMVQQNDGSTLSQYRA